MQFNGIGMKHDAEMHHVTNCMHDHAHFRKETGDMGAGASGMKSQTMENVPGQEEGQLSLSAWLEKLRENGKRFLRGIWNGDPAGQEGKAADGTGAGKTVELREDAAAEQAVVRGTGVPSAVNASQAAAASQGVPPSGMIADNPYFSAVSGGESREKDIWQKMRVRFRDVKGQLAGHLPGKFFHAQTKNSFQAGKRSPREDLRKRSRFHGDELEIDCILTEDSYLLDSYDRKGAYSKLSAKK